MKTLEGSGTFGQPAATHLLGIFSCKKPKSENCGIDANRICKLLQPRVTPATSLNPILIKKNWVIGTLKINLTFHIKHGMKLL